MHKKFGVEFGRVVSDIGEQTNRQTDTLIARYPGTDLAGGKPGPSLIVGH